MSDIISNPNGNRKKGKSDTKIGLGKDTEYLEKYLEGTYCPKNMKVIPMGYQKFGP
jgi:hypothetical protein